PNLLQNLFGEGVLSASFIPVYIGLIAQGDEEEARRVAGGVLAILALSTAVFVAVGVVAAPWLIDLIAAGFHGTTRVLTIRLVRILFPGAGLLVLSAWCLGVLNSHRKFFLSYAAPVIWNAAIIAAMVAFGFRYGRFDLAEWTALGAVVGSALQVGIQWPAVVKILGHVRLSLHQRAHHVREIIRNAMPVFAGRGVIQISAYIDAWLASWLPTGSMATLAYSQTLYLLPISLFGMSVSAVELPAMSGAMGGTSTEEGKAVLRQRLGAGLRQITFFVLPSALAYLVLGDVIVAAIYKTGAFGPRDVLYVWGTLAGATVGLLATALGRLYSSTYYALRDTKSPLHYALVRMSLTTVLGVIGAFWLPGWLGIPGNWGVAGLTLAAAIAGWVEMTLLRRGLRRHLQAPRLSRRFLAKVAAAAAVAAIAGRALLEVLPHWGTWATAVLVLGLYGLVYLGAAWLLRVPELHALRRLLRAGAR
ncbi:MAG: murein biosynthesis integral membrane protein MurJ, partial [Terriglobales bacterium]